VIKMIADRCHQMAARQKPQHSNLTRIDIPEGRPPNHIGTSQPSVLTR
jgi:hypothetical protein